MFFTSVAKSLAALALAGIPCFAQGTASLRGLVTDPHQAVIPAAKVTLKETATGVSRATITQPNGEYQFLQIAPGSYQLVIESPGFSVHKIEGIQLLVDTPATIDVRLEVAASASVVTVEAEVTQ